MNVAIIQPRYSILPDEGEACFAAILDHLNQCDDTMDVIVLPEYSDLPYDERDPERFVSVSGANGLILAEEVRKTAIRCRATVFYNRFDFTENGMRNTTFAVNSRGETVGKYVKEHPAPSEVKAVADGGHGLDVSYSYAEHSPTVLEIDGVRYGFITCYDSYFYEYYSRLARQKPDVIVACSLQRTDEHETLETFAKFLSYNTNTYLVRSSVSLGEKSEVCGCSMVSAPDGKILLNMKNRVGIGTCIVDPTKKYLKPAGFGGKPQPHHEYTEVGRRPWLYRPAGSFIVPDDRQMPYPRICAHRGFNSVAPENSLPAYGAAIALGAEEIEFDLWATRDGELVSIHDGNLDRVSDGTGNIWDYTYEELLQFDFGYKFGEAFRGLRIVKFEEILRKFACMTIMNIHVKIWDMDAEEKYYRKIGDLIRRYDCQNHVYVMTVNNQCLTEFHEYFPEIRRCKGYDGERYVEDAIALKVDKVQLFKPYFDRDTVEKAHAHGILCNVFYADEPEEARRYISMGIDCILTNDYLRIRNAIK